MTIQDGDQSGDNGDESQPGPRRGRRRTRVAVGVAGLAVVLGGGAYLVTSAIADDESTVAQQPGGVAPAVVAPSSSGEPEVSASAAVPASVAAPASAAAKSAEAISPKVRKEIEDARKKMAKDGVKVQRPVPPKTTAQAADVKLTDKGSLKEGGILRMITAKEDLTGQRELGWVAGGVAKHRGVPCSQTFQFSTNPTPKKKANLLMCWRTSAKKSVIAIVVDPKGHPSRDKAVDALEKKWTAMG